MGRLYDEYKHGPSNKPKWAETKDEREDRRDRESHEKKEEERKLKSYILRMLKIVDDENAKKKLTQEEINRIREKCDIITRGIHPPRWSLELDEVKDYSKKLIELCSPLLKKIDDEEMMPNRKRALSNSSEDVRPAKCSKTQNDEILETEKIHEMNKLNFCASKKKESLLSLQKVITEKIEQCDDALDWLLTNKDSDKDAIVAKGRGLEWIGSDLRRALSSTNAELDRANWYEFDC